ncbi:Ysc83p KNAG_0I01570 [Huiozyma naganishii CBS 8797]|uniref:Uncharacterized protein n=1 Tax=Huiozyma naganishii (strain ATCC MYA-139 / BCRC 22969 / CBS 8797 / KCTC 17520 / NBRC 10181 / NCYC 3082 / Yp74L-3) TaxID=1071383 RepID=J7S968_HUIN7|nr:hypothetical protein KNAG_0I01570 [Kazachstania naganishii CBS 8797]CCK71944.1 hypothetical protein KNAG_0I01570 [Kazachstania naganishii CBS 8797]
MGQEGDIVDQVFGWGDRVVGKTSELVSKTGKATFDAVNAIKTQLRGADVDILPAVGQHEHAHLRRSVDYYFSKFAHTGRRHWAVGLGSVAAASLVTFKLYQLLSLPEHVPIAKDGRKQIILILGDLNDPIIRSQVMDLYRRRYTVFVCSENADRYKGGDEETECLIFIDPRVQNDLLRFTTTCQKNRLYSILFMPSLAYHKPGETSTDMLQAEIKSNVLINYNSLLQVLPHLPADKTQLILFNPSLSYNLEAPHHPTETFVSGFITSVYKSLKNYHTLDVCMIHMGLFQVRGQLSNYKYLDLKGSNIYNSLHTPVYQMIMHYNGNRLQRFLQYCYTLGRKSNVYYLGNYSFLSTLCIFPVFLEIESIYSGLKSFFHLRLPDIVKSCYRFFVHIK